MSLQATALLAALGAVALAVAATRYDVSPWRIFGLATVAGIVTLWDLARGAAVHYGPTDLLGVVAVLGLTLYGAAALRAVAEELLDGAEIGAALHEMGREGVAQPVRVGRDPPQRARVEPRASHRDEERVLRAAHELRPRLAQVAGEPVRRLLAERHHAL